MTKPKVVWQHCVIIGCNCKRKRKAERDGGFLGEDEWICRGHWSMASKRRRTVYWRFHRRVRIEHEEGGIELSRLWRIYLCLWERLKREITDKAIGI